MALFLLLLTLSSVSARVVGLDARIHWSGDRAAALYFNRVEFYTTGEVAPAIVGAHNSTTVDRSFPAFGHFALHDKTGNIVKRSPLRTLYYMRPAPGKPIEALWRKGHEWRKDDSPESLSISGHRSASDEYFSVCVKDGFCDGYDVAGKHVFRFANVGKDTYRHPIGVAADGREAFFAVIQIGGKPWSLVGYSVWRKGREKRIALSSPEADTLLERYKIQRSQIWLPGDPRPRLR